jgi:hypothetical protein
VTSSVVDLLKCASYLGYTLIIHPLYIFVKCLKTFLQAC